jgi:diguanylate cyclase (GGDEF)-like protein
MKSRKPLTSFAPHEIRRFAMPLTLASVFILVGLIVESIINRPAIAEYLILYGISGTIYVLIVNLLVIRMTRRGDFFNWVNSIISGFGLGLLVLFVPGNLREVAHILIILGALAITTISGRYQTYIALLGILAISLPRSLNDLTSVENILEYFMPIFISLIVTETIVRIKDTTQGHIHRLETINKISRQIMQSLDTEQTLSLLNATIQDALEADTYFIGIVKSDELHLDLFYDDGEYFNGTRVPLDGTLSGWVIKHQRELFLPDLREEAQLEGVKLLTIGKEKTSLSWIGVPLKAGNVDGIIALASYQPNAFDRADLELLSNLAQHVTLALDNSIRHAQVEEQARLDSLTGVYNHGYFLKRLEEQAEEATGTNKPLSLIMMDIDYFKQYNDTFGHLVGDQILQSLCMAIKQHIKQKDAVGRWGGEEFAISLPGATGEQAMAVACRISETMANLRVEDREGQPVPVPTVSQGIAVFPTEADEIFRLIDLADRRLYVAKERGRNQVEPAESHWRELHHKTK